MDIFTIVKNNNFFNDALKLLTEDLLEYNNKNKWWGYLRRDENAGGRDYYDLMGSIFYIRNVDECISNFGMSGNESKFKKEEKTSKELSFLNKERIHQNNRFYLQH